VAEIHPLISFYPLPIRCLTHITASAANPSQIATMTAASFLTSTL